MEDVVTANAERVKERIATLKTVWPEDERLRNAILMSMGCTEQLPVMNDAFQAVLFALPSPGTDTVGWESGVHLALTDVIRWATNIELALHDLRQALFFRYNKRVTAMKQPTLEEQEQMTLASEEITARDARRKEAQRMVAEEKERKKDPQAAQTTPQVKAETRIANLFDR
jgi:hypothetical protein